jgi:hypothetical protein
MDHAQVSASTRVGLAKDLLGVFSGFDRQVMTRDTCRRQAMLARVNSNKKMRIQWMATIAERIHAGRGGCARSLGQIVAANSTVTGRIERTATIAVRIRAAPG